MTGNYAYTPLLWPFIFITLLLITLSIVGWRRRNVPGALPFAISSLLAAVWMAGSFMELSAGDVATKILWLKFQAVVQLPAVTALTCFILEYAWPGRWSSRRVLALLSFPPLLFLGLVLSDNLHHLAWLSFTFDGSVIPLRGPVVWAYISYGMLLGIIEIAVFIWLFRQSPQHRWPVAIMLAGQVGARTIYLLDASNTIQPGLPLDAFIVVFLFLTYAIALFGFQILDPIPMARMTVIEQLRDGMLVLDPQGRVAGLNPAAEWILGAPANDMKGKPVHDLLPAYPNEPLTGPGETRVEFSLGTGHEPSAQGVRHYILVVSPLKDWRGLEAGHLLMLRDVTEQRRAQAQILDQQRALATLQERERLARELHDGLGQALAAAHLQASTAKLLLTQGEAARINECLDNLLATTLQAEADMREYLLGIQTEISPGQPFLAVLREYHSQFSRLYGLPIEIDVPAELEETELDQTVAVQLLRIIQEALSNVRKHACAHQARIKFAVSDTSLHIAVSDDGRGFDPSGITPRQARGFGLRSMRERAEALGGSLEVNSLPGHGTQVVARVPVKKDTGTQGLGDTEIV